MKQKIFAVIGLITALIVCSILFFNQRFYPNTVLDMGILQTEVGLKSYNSVSADLKEKLENYTYMIIDSDLEKHAVKLGDISKEIDSAVLLKSLKEIQKKIGSSHYSIDLNTIVVIDDTKVDSFLKSIVSNERVSENAYITFDSALKEYVIEPERIGNVYKEDAAELFIDGLKEQQIDLVDMSVYELPDIVSTDSELLSNLDNLNSFKNVVLEYSFGNNVETLGIDFFNSWLSPKSSEVVVNEEKVEEYVSLLNQKYTTLGNQRTFKTSTGENITLTKGDYGWWLDKGKMKKDILDHLSNKESVKAEGIYKQKAETYGDLDFTDSYVEVSIANQHLWMYVKGELLVDCSVVTGDVNKGHSTPKGIYSLTYKTRNAVLRGPGYASPVSYWMPFNGGVGLHDATWRSSFGGKIYINNGSHGCVNMPFKSAKTVYENLSSTMPIIVW